MALASVGPTGLFGFPTSLQSRKYRFKKFQLFCSHDSLSVENSENPQSENHEKRKHSRFSHLRNHLQEWSSRPTVKRHKFPWEERQEEKEKEKERAKEVATAVDEDEDLDLPSGVSRVSRSVPTAPWVQAWDNSGNKEGIQSSVDPISNETEQDDTLNAAEKFRPMQDLGGFHQRTASQQIVVKLRKFAYPDEDRKSELAPKHKSTLINELFDVEESETLPSTPGGNDFDGSWSAPYELGNAGGPFPWDKKEEKSQGVDGRPELRARRAPTLAEQTIPEPELNRLRSRGVRLKERIKLGSAGVTRAIVEKVHEKWRNTEIVKFKCEGSSALNMKRTHEFLERRTGGLVIWRSGGSLVLYRGMTYEPPSLKAAKLQADKNQGAALGSGAWMQSGAETVIRNKPIDGIINNLGRNTADSHVGTEIADEKKPIQPPSDLDYESEMNKILDELGPRFTDWSGCNPLPVDADLLPKLVPGYKEPFRLLPYGVRHTLSNMEMTNLRRLARRLPPHFALGRNRQHQGLAAAIVKLWEKSEIAKIAIKRGVQNTSNERMAEEIKNLTGGTLLSRNKEFIVIYRGKDFLPSAVAATLMEREVRARELQDEEERSRLKASSTLLEISEEADAGPSFAGTLAESLEAKARWSKHIDSQELEKMRIAAVKARKADIARKLERKLALAQKKVAKAEKDLAKVEAFLLPAKSASDQETITDEERFMFRKLGLRMQAFLLLGRRGIFDGTVENMHLHWKHRELVKIISKEKSLAEVKYTALMLEAESGGILVSVDKISKGYAIIVYRGKNYQRPLTIKPKTLLTKRKALKRSIELQRRESLNRHILQLEKNMEQLKFELSRIEDIDENQSTTAFNAELGSAYLSEDEEDEDEYSEGDEDEVTDEDGDKVVYHDHYDNYSENEDSSLELERETPENGKIMEENVIYGENSGINFEADSIHSSEVEKEELDQYEVPLQDIEAMSAEIIKIQERDSSCVEA